MAFGQSNPVTEITPYRNTKLHLDLPAHQVRQQGFAATRQGAQIAPYAAATGGKDSNECWGVRYWPGAKCWTLQPLQERMTNFQEAFPQNVVPEDIYLTPTDTSLAALAVLADQQAYYTPFGFGMLYRGDVLSDGDRFYQKHVPANGSWAGKLTSEPPPPQGDTTTTPGTSQNPPQVAVLAPPIAPLDTIFESTTKRPDQGFCLRWTLPGGEQHNPDYVLNFYFGQYCAIITGDGQVHLTEYCRQSIDGPYRWVIRTTFRYSKQNQVSGRTHSLIIFPVMSKRGPMLEFSGTSVEGALLDGSVSTPLSYTYLADLLSRYGDVNEAPGHVTRAGVARVDVRRDLRVGFQVTYLLWVKRGELYDGTWSDDGRGVTEKKVAMDYIPAWPLDYGSHVSSATITYLLVDPETGDVKPDTFAGPYSTKFSFLGHNSTKEMSPETPILYGHTVSRDSEIVEVSPNDYATGDDEIPPLMFEPRTVQFNCQGANPLDDGGELMFFAGDAESKRLRNRGVLEAKLTTTARKPDGTEQIVTLFRGEVKRPNAVRRGRKDATGPLDKPWQCSLPLRGYADKLGTFSSRNITKQAFADDRESPLDPGLQQSTNGNLVPWRVVDVIQYLLKLVFPAEQVIIPSNPIRLFASAQSGSENLFYDPTVNVLNRVQRLAANYLGGYLIYDTSLGSLAPSGRPDAGSPEGAWTILFPPPEGATPLLNFVDGLEENDDGTFRLPMAAASYPPFTVVATGDEEEKPERPEVNHVHVFTATGSEGKQYKYEAHVYNVESYDVPGFTTKPNPNSPHWIGYEVPRVIPDPSLCVPGDPVASQNAVNYVARRVLNYAGRGANVREVFAPLVFVLDPVSDRLRMPRFGDPASWRGESGWFIRSCSPQYSLDSAQMAHYEIVKYAPLYSAPVGG